MRVKRVGRMRRLSAACKGAVVVTIGSFLHAVEASSGVGGGHHPTVHALGYILPREHNTTASAAGSGQFPEFGAFTEDSMDENGMLESSAPPGQPPGGSAQTVIDIIAVFGAIFLAAVAIILITVYISKLRKRQSSTLSPDIEVASTTAASISSCDQVDPGSPASIAQLNKEVQEAWSAIDFGHKPSLWRKTIRSVILRMRGQEQHKDVYVMPQHLRHQLKQMYVY